MFAVTVAFGNISWRLLYKSEEKAEAAFKTSTLVLDNTQHFNTAGTMLVSGERVELIDDFGQRCSFRRSDVGPVMLENLDESKIGAIEMGLHNKRTEVGFQARAEQDPTVRAAGGRSPAIINPMGNGRFSQ